MIPESERPRGVNVYPFTDDAVTGPLDRYALLVRSDNHAVRMVHTEGVTYLVTDEKPWTWNDYNPRCPKFSPGDLIRLAVEQDIQPVDLADWVREYNARLEGNFAMAYSWATTAPEEPMPLSHAVTDWQTWWRETGQAEARGH